MSQNCFWYNLLKRGYWTNAAHYIPLHFNYCDDDDVDDGLLFQFGSQRYSPVLFWVCIRHFITDASKYKLFYLQVEPLLNINSKKCWICTIFMEYFYFDSQINSFGFLFFHIMFLEQCFLTGGFTDSRKTTILHWNNKIQPYNNS